MKKKKYKKYIPLLMPIPGGKTHKLSLVFISSFSDVPITTCVYIHV